MVDLDKSYLVVVVDGCIGQKQGQLLAPWYWETGNSLARAGQYIHTYQVHFTDYSSTGAEFPQEMFCLNVSIKVFLRPFQTWNWIWKEFTQDWALSIWDYLLDLLEKIVETKKLSSHTTSKRYKKNVFFY